TDALTRDGDSDQSGQLRRVDVALAAETAVQSPVPETATSVASPQAEAIGPEQVLEALLFVGGKPLTIKALGAILRNEFDAAFIETAIEQLRDKYANQNRPYEIRLTDGGYCMVLRSDFEPERNRVYGFGPRQVRLSQDTLEVLSLVAYRQPISRR